MQWRIQHLLKVKYAKMVTNLLKDYIVINETVKQKIKIQYRLKCAKIKYSQ